MNKIYLTNHDRQLLDPTGKGYRHIQAYKAPPCFAPKSKYFKEFSISDWFNTVVVKQLSQNNSQRHALYLKYCTEMLDKCGPQGGHYSFETLESLVEEYYVNAEQPVYIDEALIQGRDALLRIIASRLEKSGPPQYVAPKYYMTSSGLYTMSKKGSWSAETHASKYWIHPYPNMPGQRVMRNKQRVIFMDDVANVRAIEETLSSVRDWLRTNIPEFFGAWLNPMEGVNPDITRYVDKHAMFVESDYKGMDMHFTWSVTQQLVLPVYEVLAPDTYLSFASFVEELFRQPLYMGNYLITGLHTIFSGQAFTNDFETIYSVILYLGKAIMYGILENVILKAIGDDVTLGILHCTKRFPYYLLDSIIDSSNQAGMVIHSIESGKSAIREGETIFCRKVYYPQGKRRDNILIGAYPSPLVLNNIIQPERLSPTMGRAAIATLQRLDNAEGSPDYSQLVQTVIKISNLNLMQFTESDLEMERDNDWWFKVYGESWNPVSSHTYTYLKAIHYTM